jgi:predicted ATP-grasp superfamily ATP-dependent carboligase
MIQLIDLNPRLTASTDLYEHSTDLPSIVGLHVEACEPTYRNPPKTPRPFATTNHWDLAAGKAIVYSPLDRPLTIAPSAHRWLAGDPASSRAFRLADIPRPGTEILPYQPICTVYETVSRNCLQLRKTAAGVELSEGIGELQTLLRKRADQITERLRSEDREASGKRISES